MKHQNLLIVLTIAGLLGSHLVFYHAFLTAYFSPDKAVMIFIDRYNEANIELAFTSLFTVLGLIFVPLLTVKLGREAGRTKPVTKGV